MFFINGTRLHYYPATRFAAANQEYPANPQAQPTDIVRGFGTPVQDPIAVAEVGKLQPTAAKLMDRIGWR